MGKQRTTIVCTHSMNTNQKDVKVTFVDHKSTSAMKMLVGGDSFIYEKVLDVGILESFMTAL